MKPASATPTRASSSRWSCAIRRAKLPDPAVIGNAGSFFKNPSVTPEQCEDIIAARPQVVHYPMPDGSVKLAAGWLIDACGWKGKTVGHAGVYDRQALVLVNRDAEHPHRRRGHDAGQGDPDQRLRAFRHPARARAGGGLSRQRHRLRRIRPRAWAAAGPPAGTRRSGCRRRDQAGRPEQRRHADQRSKLPNSIGIATLVALTVIRRMPSATHALRRRDVLQQAQDRGLDPPSVTPSRADSAGRPGFCTGVQAEPGCGERQRGGHHAALGQSRRRRAAGRITARGRQRPPG